MNLSDILDTLSHDLKSPLVKIKAQLIIAQHKNASAAEMKDRIQHIDDLLTKLNGQLDTVFETLSYLAGNTQFLYEFFDINSLLAEVQKGAGQVTITAQPIENSTSMLADKTTIRKAILLCIRTLRYKNDDSSITLTCRVTGKKVLFDIHPNTFPPGSIRADAGLFLAHHIVTAHGGKLEQLSDPVGIRIQLPLKAKKMK